MPMGQRRKARELAFQLLYARDQSKRNGGEIPSEMSGSAGLSGEAKVFAAELMRSALRDLKIIDAIIGECSLNWKIERIIPTDRNIMRIAVGEMLNKTAPAAVVINEAIEISKKFGTASSGNFVNGILDCVRKKLEERDA